MPESQKQAASFLLNLIIEIESNQLLHCGFWNFARMNSSTTTSIQSSFLKHLADYGRRPDCDQLKEFKTAQILLCHSFQLGNFVLRSKRKCHQVKHALYLFGTKSFQTLLFEVYLSSSCLLKGAGKCSTSSSKCFFSFD